MTDAPAPSRAPWLLFAAALSLRLALLFLGPWGDPARATFDDSTRYLNLAANLKDKSRFGLAEEEPAVMWAGLYGLRVANGTQPPRDDRGLIPELFRTPGYPAAIAAAWSLTGDVRAILLVQCLAGAAAAVALRKLALALGLSSGAALLAGGLWACHPSVVGRDCQFMTESLFASLGVFGLTASATVKGWKGWLLAGACLGFAGLVRPLAALYVPAACAFAARHAPRRWLAVLAIAAVTALPSVAWMARNAGAGHGFRLTSVNDATLLYYFAGYAISEERGEDWQRAFPTRCGELLAKLEPRVKPGDDVLKAMRTLALEELAARPQATAKVLAKSWVKLAVSHSAHELYQLCGATYRPSNLVARLVLREGEGVEAPPDWGALLLPLAWTGLNAAIALLAALGVIRSLRQREWGFVLPLVLTVALFTLATASQGMERFRSPVVGALLLLAARGVAQRGREPDGRGRGTPRLPLPGRTR